MEMRHETRKAGEKNEHTRESHGVDVFAVVGKGHVGLAEANGVLALGDTVEDFELLLGDALG